MMRVLPMLSKRDWADAPKVIAIAAGKATDAFPDETKSSDEIVVREIFNSGANNVYYCYGADCDNLNNFNAYLVPGQMLEVSTLQRVSLYSVNGTNVALTEIRRQDLVAHQNIIGQLV